MDYPNIAFLILHQLLSGGCNWLISCPWTVFADWIPPFIKVEWRIQWIASIPRCYARKTARLRPIIGLYFSLFSYTSWTDGLRSYQHRRNLNEKKMLHHFVVWCLFFYLILNRTLMFNSVKYYVVFFVEFYIY